MSDLSTRLAANDDGGGIARLIAEVFADYPGCVFDPVEFPELERIADHFARKDGRIWVVEREGRIVGSLAIFRGGAPETFELAKVYLARAVRGRGIAADLLSRAIRHARERGARRIELFTDTRFSDGHRFYERHGFRRLPGERCLADRSASWEYHYARDI